LVGRLLADCFRDAGLPDGVFNYISGPGEVVGQTLAGDPGVAGITFTGSYDVGMKIYRDFSRGQYPRPLILEMGGKNPAIVSRNADLDLAAEGIVRAAYGLQGQKCSACSRVIAEESIKQELTDRIVELARAISVGDPTERQNWMGPVINRRSYGEFSDLAEELSQAGRIVTGGAQMTERELAKGYYCSPTVVDEVPKDHRLWKHEMFLPITMITDAASLEEAMAIANDVDYGLTAGFYGAESEAQWFFDNIEAGVNYANRSQGATTGAWPGYQPFGGWKGSGSSGKFAGGPYYVTLYMHEQSQTVIKRMP
jgi:1-pyrroline-5-carboxylate dehydrogenase